MTRITRRAFLRGGLAASVGAAAGTGAYGMAYERHHLSLTRTTVTIPSLPTALDGVRIGVLTDLHHSRLVSQEHIARAASLLTAERPDLVALLGDYVTWGDRGYIAGCVEALGGLSAPSGVFAVLGNHDDERALPRALGRQGVDVLTDQRTQLRIRGTAVTIAGLSYWTKKPVDIARIVRGQENVVLLAHDPRRLYEAAGLGVPLVLSGHTHGGQIVLPVIGAVAARKFPIAQGLARLGSTSLFVSRGVGTVFVPMRLNCPPEAALITLRVPRSDVDS